MNQPIKIDYLNSLVRLVNKCKEEHVKINEFGTLHGGLYVKFEGFTGDAVIHEHSYGSNGGCFETMGMPWDIDDVTVLEPEELAMMLGAALRGDDWDNVDFEEYKPKHAKKV